MTALRANRGPIVRIASSTALALVLAAAPLAVDIAGHGVDLKTASAKGGGGGGGAGGGAGGGGAGGGGGNGGGGNGGGNGGGAAGNAGGNGSGDGGGLGSTAGRSDGGHGVGVGGTPPGHDGRAASASGTPPGQAEGRSEARAPASTLGKLNAAHASPTALSNAAPNSTVGLLGAYRDAVAEGITVEEATAQLSDISNKEVSPEVVNTVNDLLGVSTDEQRDADTAEEGATPAS